ncbi:hypothetical protein [Lichenihabitans psoromatis]|uniref:hypothetical protein n=1 Tax=Lichenihabitans psoromatis TaxID=2528642 RepID=UPI001038514F|nr:hypothetical protein [Lichenihabitans psoromatis]
MTMMFAKGRSGSGMSQRENSAAAISQSPLLTANSPLRNPPDPVSDNLARTLPAASPSPKASATCTAIVRRQQQWHRFEVVN